MKSRAYTSIAGGHRKRRTTEDLEERESWEAVGQEHGKKGMVHEPRAAAVSGQMETSVEGAWALLLGHSSGVRGGRRQVAVS